MGCNSPAMGGYREGSDSRARLVLLTDLLGPVFGTENICYLLHAMVRMRRCARIVELGTGLGVSAFWMASAARLNGVGHLWTVDDDRLFRAEPTLLSSACSALTRAGFGSIEAATPDEYFGEVSRTLGLDATLTRVNSRIDLGDPDHLARYPFLTEQPIDLLFSDFSHGPLDVLGLLAQCLPLMAPASSIFIDSSSTVWSSYLLLEALVQHLNRGAVPQALQEQATVDLSRIMATRRLVLVHLTEDQARRQNSTSWLKMEPIDVLAQPRAQTLGFSPTP